jgi:hypothetical protein
MMNKKTPKKDELFVRQYIEKVQWKFAKTYAKSAPHSYTIREWEPDLENEFERFVLIIRTYGYAERYWSKIHWYFKVEDLKYWTMGFPLERTVVINRAPIDQTYGSQHPVDEFPRKAPF